MANRHLTDVLNRLRQAALRHDGAGLTDGELLECFITRREEAAFEALLRRHGPMVLGVCRRILRNAADAEDAFQATFLVLVRKARSIRPRGMVGNWLYGVAQNTALKAKTMNIRRRKKEREAGARLRQAAPEELREELQAVLDRELPALPDKYRAPIVLCDLEGKTIREAARQLGWPQGTVATRLARGRTLLAQRLACSGLSLPGEDLTTALVHGAPVCIPALLLESTVQAATAVAAGQAAAKGLISAKVVALMEGVVRAMLITRLSAVTAVLLAVALLGGGGSLLAYRAAWAEQPDAKEIRQSQPAVTPKDEKAKSDKEALQSTWVGVDGEQDGQKLTKERYWTLALEDDKVTLQTGEGSKKQEGIFTIDPDKKPKEINLTLGSLTLSGIYELKGTKLKTFWKEGGLRPPDFDAKEGILMVFEKKK